MKRKKINFGMRNYFIDIKQLHAAKGNATLPLTDATIPFT
jgi:hypothetical protein